MFHATFDPFFWLFDPQKKSPNPTKNPLLFPMFHATFDPFFTHFFIHKKTHFFPMFHATFDPFFPHFLTPKNPLLFTYIFLTFDRFFWLLTHFFDFLTLWKKNPNPNKNPPTFSLCFWWLFDPLFWLWKKHRIFAFFPYFFITFKNDQLLPYVFSLDTHFFLKSPNPPKKVNLWVFFPIKHPLFWTALRYQNNTFWPTLRLRFYTKIDEFEPEISPTV